ncbi:accessory Sec system protein Asp2 [Streptococcus cuniculipharyngis]|uniref:Accessory Sec system protein Asp2 n=1 Tax=Streptococcus cuniculipharyngis TaxID=1562651 RepID=A0A5C5SDN7_9STRE|nr:accessory Sec system protein Asp2 [Streptococcus cuniculipharyngis]TWS98894.1 accessory Sec system protein Asp2 [Streptococcus cuniculipharyngis]
MTKEIILQIGYDNWAERYPIPANLDWRHVHPEALVDLVEARQDLLNHNKQLEELMEQASLSSDNHQVMAELEAQKEPVPDYRLLLITDDFFSADLSALQDWIEAYEVFYPSGLRVTTSSLADFLRQKKAQSFDEPPVEFLLTLSKISFKKPYGAKLPLRHFLLAPQLRCYQVCYQGSASLHLTGDFGRTYRFLGNFSYNIPYDKTSSLDFWQEFTLDGTCELLIKITLLAQGAAGQVLHEWHISGPDLAEQYHIDANQEGYLAVSLWVKGQGQLNLGPLHYRFSRKGYGQFIFGGQRYADASGQEFHYYLNPGDAKPPLMVYFSGWRTAEGFEGFPMMKKLKAPFLLICDPRLEGGSFYWGSPDFENAIKKVIQESLLSLGFKEGDDLILSGLSMGTFGALYYASFLRPHALVLGKPLTNLGQIALRERLERPAGFPTSLDILQGFAGDLTPQSASQLNQRFWQVFQSANLAQTTIYATYMTEDDYDQRALNDLLEATKINGARLVARPWPGRHNDGTREVATWFQHQYGQLLKEDFGRNEK